MIPMLVLRGLDAQTAWRDLVTRCQFRQMVFTVRGGSDLAIEREKKKKTVNEPAESSDHHIVPSY